MPVEEEYLALKDKADLLVKSGDIEVRAFNHYLRKMISVETANAEELITVVSKFYNAFAAMQAEEKEPMLNVICSYVDGKYMMHLFPRKLHRPTQYFAEGDDQILISPASVDFGGVFITPRREDFEKITAEDIEDIFNQVCVDEDVFSLLCEKIKA